MHIHNQQAKEQLTQRLRKIEGQVRGVQQMLADERDCGEIMQQMAAVRSAVQGFNRIFVQEYAAGCLLAMDDEPLQSPTENRLRRERVIQELITFLDKAP